jgi:hypothetical protein
MSVRNQVRISLAAVGLAVAAGALPAHALIIMDPTSPSTTIGNTSAPTGPTYGDFSYWDNMLGTHTYLGNGYLITANHTGGPAASITIQGNTYNNIGQQRLTDPNNPSILTDLWVWKIGGNPLPNLPTVFPIVSGLTTNEQTLIVGDGFSRAGGPTFWNVTVNAGSNNDVWNIAADEGSANAKGFLTNAQVKQWGTNKVFNPSVLIDFGPTNKTLGYQIDFSQTNATDFEAQATNEDSAGPVFVKRNGQWVLTGIMHGATTFDNQPNSPSLAGVYVHPSGQTSTTVISDLSQYTAQLVAFGVAVPEPTGLAAAGAIAMGLLARRQRRQR